MENTRNGRLHSSVSTKPDPLSNPITKTKSRSEIRATKFVAVIFLINHVPVDEQRSLMTTPTVRLILSAPKILRPRYHPRHGAGNGLQLARRSLPPVSCQDMFVVSSTRTSRAGQDLSSPPCRRTRSLYSHSVHHFLDPHFCPPPLERGSRTRFHSVINK